MIPVGKLRELLRYCPESGKIYWLARNDPRVDRQLAGKEAFASIKSGGYRHGQISGKFYKAHRVAWALFYGEWPKGQIDHINGDPTDNRIKNLRDTTPKENSANGGKRPGRNPTSQFIGVCRSKSKWEASVGFHGKTVRAGLFLCEIEAARARDRLAVQLNGQFARLNFPEEMQK